MSDPRSEKILISACSAGFPTSHDARDRLSTPVKALNEAGRGVPVCPEQLGGLPTPREASEIVDGDGHDVLKGRARVLTKSGRDVTNAFLEGARKALGLARQTGCAVAVLKARSPSCGRGEIYDGTFQGKLKPGDGVLAALLLEEGIEVVTDEDERVKEL